MSTRTCADCGARNAEGAPWCTQCYTPFGSPRAEREDAGRRAELEETGQAEVDAGPTPDVAGTPAPAASRAVSQPSAGEAAGDRPAQGTSAEQRDIRQRSDGEIEWRCATCESWNALEASACVACGAPRRGFGSGPDEPAEHLDEDRLVAATILLPGLGHLRAGRMGSGIARAVFAVGWLVGGLLLLLAAAKAGAAYLAAVPLLAGAAAVWVLSLMDVRSLARGEDRERLDGRALLWLMAGVTGALVLVLMLDTWRLAT